MNDPRPAPNHDYVITPEHMRIPTIAPRHLNPPARLRRFVIDKFALATPPK